MQIRLLEDPLQRSQVCEKVLRALPLWFGIESSILDYIKNVQTMQTWIVDDSSTAVGFLSINKHNPFTSEIYVMGILPEFHGRKIGYQLIRAAEISLAVQNFKFLTVKTLSESKPNKEYAQTRRFYLRYGFFPVEEFKTLWGEANPCLLLIKNISLT